MPFLTGSPVLCSCRPTFSPLFFLLLIHLAVLTLSLHTCTGLEYKLVFEHESMWLLQWNFCLTVPAEVLWMALRRLPQHVWIPKSPSVNAFIKQQPYYDRSLAQISHWLNYKKWTINDEVIHWSDVKPGVLQVFLLTCHLQHICKLPGKKRFLIISSWTISLRKWLTVKNGKTCLRLDWVTTKLTDKITPRDMQCTQVKKNTNFTNWLSTKLIMTTEFNEYNFVKINT